MHTTLLVSSAKFRLKIKQHEALNARLRSRVLLTKHRRSFWGVLVLGANVGLRIVVGGCHIVGIVGYHRKYFCLRVSNNLIFRRHVTRADYSAAARSILSKS